MPASGSHVGPTRPSLSSTARRFKNPPPRTKVTSPPSAEPTPHSSSIGGIGSVGVPRGRCSVPSAQDPPAGYSGGGTEKPCVVGPAIFRGGDGDWEGGGGRKHSMAGRSPTGADRPINHSLVGPGTGKGASAPVPPEMITVKMMFFSSFLFYGVNFVTPI